MITHKIGRTIAYLVIISAIILLAVALINLKPTQKQPTLIFPASYEKTKTAISNAEFGGFSISQLNEFLHQVESTSWIDVEKNKTKREIIRKAGFVNFDWKDTLADLLSFEDVQIEIIQPDVPVLLFRRGYPDEPTSKFGLGRWWSDKQRNIDKARDELAILENWGNPLSAEYSIEVPAGTRMLMGIAAPQEYKNPTGKMVESRKGGGIQYFIDTVDNTWLKK